VHAVEALHDRFLLLVDPFDEERIVVHMLVELYARSAEEATEVLEEAAHGPLEITSLAEESRPPAHASDEAH